MSAYNTNYYETFYERKFSYIVNQSIPNSPCIVFFFVRTETKFVLSFAHIRKVYT